MHFFLRFYGGTSILPNLIISIAAGITIGLAYTQVTSIATTLGLHRGMTHGAYKLSPLLNWIFRLILWLSVGIKWWAWCRVHAYHHMHTENEVDGHSPMHKGGLSGVFLHNPGLYQASADDPRVIVSLSSRFQPDRWDHWLFDREWLGRLLGISLCVLLLGFVPGVIAYVVHIFAYIYLNAAINSIGHGAEATGVNNRLERILNSICERTGERPGYEPATAKLKQVGNSLNFQWLAWITMGEGLHYNHHYRPRCATMRRFRGDHDPGLYVLYTLRALHLVGTFTVPEIEEKPLQDISQTPLHV